MSARIGIPVFLVALAAVLAVAGCGTTARSSATEVAVSAAATSHAAPASHASSATRAARATASRAGFPVNSAGSVAGCQGPIGFHRLNPWPHGGVLLWCSGLQMPSGSVGAGRP
jgi:hypothetical protein